MISRRSIGIYRRNVFPLLNACMFVDFSYAYIIELMRSVHSQVLPAWMEMQSISQAKSKIGHAVLMILQVGVLEKFKNVPLVTGLDLACFAGAVIVSSACIFLLSRLSIVEQKVEGSKPNELHGLWG